MPKYISKVAAPVLSKMTQLDTINIRVVTLSRGVLSFLLMGRVDLLLYGLHISDVKDLSVPLAHSGLESAKLLVVSRPHAYNLIGC